MKVINSGRDSVELSNINRAKSTNKAGKADDSSESKKASGSASTSGSVEISEHAKLLSKGVEAAKNADLSDKEKIAMIKERIQNNNYKPDFGKVAEKLLDEHIVNS